MSHHLGRWRLSETQGVNRFGSSLATLSNDGTEHTLQVEHGAAAYESADPDTSRVWWQHVGVHQNLTHGVHPDPVSGAHCWLQRAVSVTKAGPSDRYGTVHVDTNKSMEVYRQWKALTRSAATHSPRRDAAPLLVEATPEADGQRLPAPQGRREVSAEARHRAYALFGRVMVQGLTDEVVGTLRALPAVADTLPSGEPDAAAAAHHEALSRQVFPYESAFRSLDGLLGGAVSASVREAYRAGGFAPATASVEADHVGLQLAYLAHLSRAEADALVDGRSAQVDRCRTLATGFLDQHALRWWPSLSVALTTQTECPWLARVATLSVELAAGHRSELDRAASLADEPDAPGIDLDDPETRLRDIVGLVLSPLRSGMFLSLHGMGRAASATGLPAGFGTRAKVLESLWFTAVDHRQVPQLVEALVAEVEAAVVALEPFASIGLDVHHEQERLRRTQALLDRVAREASATR